MMMKKARTWGCKAMSRHILQNENEFRIKSIGITHTRYIGNKQETTLPLMAHLVQGWDRSSSWSSTC